VARLQGETSNRLFEILSDWNEQLSSCDLYKNPEELPFHEPECNAANTACKASGDGFLPSEKTGSEPWTD